MLIAKLILIVGFIYRVYVNIKRDGKLEDKDIREEARLATLTVFIVTTLLYYFAGIFNLTAVC